MCRSTEPGKHGSRRRGAGWISRHFWLLVAYSIRFGHLGRESYEVEARDGSLRSLSTRLGPTEAVIASSVEGESMTPKQPRWLERRGTGHGVVHVTSCPRPELACDHALILHMQDVLSAGPVLPRTVSFEAWLAARASYWAEVCPPESRPEQGLVADYYAALASAEDVYIWAGIGTDEQLMLLFTVWRLQQAGVAPERVRKIEYHRNARGVPASSILSVAPQDLLEHPEPVALAAEWGFLSAAWDALSAPEPSRLQTFALQAQPGPIRDALVRVLRRYPDPRTGLGIQDARLLRLAATVGPHAAPILAHMIAESLKELDPLGDILARWRMRRLAHPSLAAPVLRLEGGDSVRDMRVFVTAFGEKVHRELCWCQRGE